MSSMLIPIRHLEKPRTTALVTNHSIRQEIETRITILFSDLLFSLLLER